MLFENIQHAPVVLALQKTFDGKHPCKLCNLVSAGKKSEQKQDVKKSDLKMEFLLAAVPALLFPPRLDAARFAPPVLPSARSELPATPPPRAA